MSIAISLCILLVFHTRGRDLGPQTALHTVSRCPMKTCSVMIIVEQEDDALVWLPSSLDAACFMQLSFAFLPDEDVYLQA